MNVRQLVELLSEYDDDDDQVMLVIESKSDSLKVHQETATFGVRRSDDLWVVIESR